ncbi:MAG: hypothetical protein EA377_03415, partial [Phycisphaerales bacterium]
ERDIPIITVEDHSITGGFGSCVLDAASDAGLDTRKITRLALPESWIYQGGRGEQLEEAGLDPVSIARTVRDVLDAGGSLPDIEVKPSTKRAVNAHRSD